MNTTPREEALFQTAAPLGAADRAAFLDRECAGDPALRARLDALLDAHDQPDTMDGPGYVAPQPTIRLDMVHDSTDDAVGLTLGRYKLLERLGEGGCGVVYVAEQTEPVRRRVALKLIKPGMDSKAVIARFEAERQALAMMDHPNIAKVLDAGTTETGRPYFVMELVRGIRITEYCDQEKLPTGDRLHLFIKVCQAIQHAHQKGIIHRDIKPSNILVTLHDGVPVPKVIDFGIAKATEGRLTDATVYTQLHQFLGTPAYMSPEQAEMSGLDIDTRSDIYSLGVLLYELLTGVTPFDAKELMSQGLDAMRRTIREKEPVRPSTRLTQIQATRQGTPFALRHSPLASDLDWIVMKCLEKDRGRRYETANGLAADLKRHLHNEPVVARPPSAAYRFQKAWRRNKLVLTAGAAVGLALLVGSALSLWQAFEANRAREIADAARLAEEQQRIAAQDSQREAEQDRKRAEHRERSEQALRYVANMTLAQEAWTRQRAGRIRELLEDSEQAPDLGFEWHYWQRQIHGEIGTFRGHFSPLWSAALSPDGRRVATGGGLVGGTSSVGDLSDRTIRIWDVTTGEVIATCRGHAGEVLSVAFSPNGERILSASTDRTARLWESSSGRPIMVLRGHGGPVTVGTFSPDGTRILTAGFDHTARLSGIRVTLDPVVAGPAP